MGKTKIAITLEEESIEQLDRLVNEQVFQNRSQAIQEAVVEKLQRMKKSRLAKECAKLDPSFEKAMAAGNATADFVHSSFFANL